MITSLTLKHWRTHKETTLEFGKGTNVIVGVMGSGKSSIVNAISYSLFGSFPALKNKSVSLKEIIMSKPNIENKAETGIEIEQEGKKYKVERIIKLDGTNEAKLYENDKLVAGPKQKDVNEKVEKLLGLNYELFSRAVYAEQNEMDFFLKLSPGERKKKFDELLELEKYEEARKNAVTLQNDLVKENKQRKEFIEQQKQTINSHEEEKILKLITDEENSIKELEKEVTQLKKQLLEFEKEFGALSEKEKQNRVLEELSIKVASKIEALKGDLTKNEKASLKELESEIEKIKKEIIQLKEKQSTRNNEQKITDGELKKYVAALGVIEYEKKKILEEEKGILALKGKCPTCKQELDENHKTHLTQELKEKLTKANENEKELEKLKKTTEEKKNHAEKELEQINKELEEKNKLSYKLELQQKQVIEAEQKKKQLEDLIEELPKLKKQLTELGFDKKKLDGVREELYKTKSSVSVAETKIKSKLELKKSYEATLTKIEQIKKNIVELEKLATKNEDAGKTLGVFANCLIATQTQLRETMLATINSAMTSIWNAVYPYKDFTDARLSVTEEGYDLQVQTRNNEWVRVEGILSGGERSAAALCIRMAFALVLTKKLSMLILDEPTHNLDSNAVQKLSSTLREEMPKLVEQIFVITHDKQLENAASSNLYLLTRNKDLDETTKTEQKQAY
jgi:exonuclease SbcC